MPFALRATTPAHEAIDGLRGRTKKAYEQLTARLRAEGCVSGGYRLLAADGAWSEFCCVHLDGKWRVVVTFEENIVWIVAVGQHDGEAFYNALAAAYHVSAIGQRRDKKPKCCDPATGWPHVGPARAADHAKSRRGDSNP